MNQRKIFDHFVRKMNQNFSNTREPSITNLIRNETIVPSLQFQSHKALLFATLYITHQNEHYYKLFQIC